MTSATAAVRGIDTRASTYDGSRLLEALLFTTVFAVTFAKLRIKVGGDLNFFVSDLTALLFVGAFLGASDLAA